MTRFLIAFLSSVIALTSSAYAAGDAKAPPHQHWHHGGLFGTYDREAAQRGLQVYREVCATCHSMDYVAYRNLTNLGFSEEEVKAIAGQDMIMDGPNDAGQMFERAARPADRFKKPFPSEQAARDGNNGAYPPDLSLMAKARPHGEDYIYALMTGYEDAPADVDMMPGMYYNPYFPGGQIAMPEMLSDGGVDYYGENAPPATAKQQAHDVAVFLAWAAEPHLEARKRMGLKVMFFLLAFAGMMYAVKRKVWSDVHVAHEAE